MSGFPLGGCCLASASPELTNVRLVAGVAAIPYFIGLIDFRPVWWSIYDGAD
jgi:hypothetical protein